MTNDNEHMKKRLYKRAEEDAIAMGPPYGKQLEAALKRTINQFFMTVENEKKKTGTRNINR